MSDQDRREHFRLEAANGIAANVRHDRGKPFMSTWTIERFDRLTLFGRRYFSRIKSSNGETVYQSEGVHNRADRDRTVERAQANIGTAKVIDVAK